MGKATLSTYQQGLPQPHWVQDIHHCVEITTDTALAEESILCLSEKTNATNTLLASTNATSCSNSKSY